MKQAFPDMIGNGALRDRLAKEAISGTLSHAYIIEGAPGSGRHTLALQLAAAMACEEKHSEDLPLPCGRCLSCRKILGGFSTDVIYVNREDKASLGVGAIRKLREEVCFPPNDTSVKLFIIEEAHLMTEEAQNAFLLTLEEPPAYILFLLLCDTAAPLLDTVKSRAPVLRTEPLDREQIDSFVCAKHPHAARMKQTEPERYGEILAAADGSIGRALRLLDPENSAGLLKGRELAREFAAVFSKRESAKAVLLLFRSFPQKRDALIEQLETVWLCLRDLLLCKQSDRVPLCFFATFEDASELAYRFTTPELLSLCDHVRGACDSLRANANINLTLTALAANVGLL